MKTNLLKTGIVLLAVAFVGLQACEKKAFTNSNETVKNAENNSPNENYNLSEMSEGRYVLNGNFVLESNIDIEQESISYVHGYGKDIYVFYSDEEVLKWANSNKLQGLVESMENIEIARNYAIKTGDYYKEKPSKEYDKWLKDNFGASAVKSGFMYDNYNFTGYLGSMAPVPVYKLSSSQDNKISSFRAFVNSYTLFDRSWWRGDKNFFLNLSPVGGMGWSLGYMNNITTSYWAY